MKLDRSEKLILRLVAGILASCSLYFVFWQPPAEPEPEPVPYVSPTDAAWSPALRGMMATRKEYWVKFVGKSTEGECVAAHDPNRLNRPGERYEGPYWTLAEAQEHVRR